MNIKKDDKVKIIAGKDKGKTGKVLQVFPREKKVSIEGLNLLIKHLRPRAKGEQGQRIEFPSPLSLSNVMFICPKCNKPAKTGRKIVDLGDGKKKKFRFCKKCSESLD